MYSKKTKGFLAFANIFLALDVICCVVPLVLLVISSFTDNTALIRNGYQFIPEKFSLDAYAYLLKSGKLIMKAYGMSFIVTGLGVAVSLTVTTMLAYAISRPGIPGKKILTFFVFFTMLFNGGLVPTYMMYTGVFHIKNTIWALLIPNLLVRAYYVMLMRSYFQTSIPEEILEAASIDGASEFQTFYKVSIPMAKPIIATVALFSMILYWNDWQNGLYYHPEPSEPNDSGDSVPVLQYCSRTDRRYVNSALYSCAYGNCSNRYPSDCSHLSIYPE